jgi:hypothetical protein
MDEWDYRTQEKLRISTSKAGSAQEEDFYLPAMSFVSINNSGELNFIVQLSVCLLSLNMEFVAPEIWSAHLLQQPAGMVNDKATIPVGLRSVSFPASDLVS